MVGYALARSSASSKKATFKLTFQGNLLPVWALLVLGWILAETTVAQAIFPNALLNPLSAMLDHA